jgi:subtilisin family serine protease
MVKLNRDGAVQVYIRARALDAAALAVLGDHEAEIELVSEALGLVQAWVPFDRIEGLAALDLVEQVARPSYAHSRIGSVTSEGDQDLRADDLRGLRNVTGKGVRVGVISAGAESIAAAQASGDLPNKVRTFGSCNFAVWDAASCDEGTAMMEIVHDLAPGARLGFAAVATSAEFIKAVNNLVNKFGADVVVDDIGFFGEPFFADGPVAKAAAAVSKRALFVSAAGNDAEVHYEARFRETTFNGVGPLIATTVHNFGAAAGRSKDTSMDIDLGPGESVQVVLQWNDPFGGSSNDYDLFLINQNGTVIDSGEVEQNGSQDPLEFVIAQNSSLFAVTWRVVVRRFSGNARRLEMYFQGGTIAEYNVPSGSVFGHPAAKKVLAVGAIDARDPGNDRIESFSSRGPARVFFPKKRKRRKPDVAGIDGVRTTGPGAFPVRFFGTSAAAPHLAGVAALLFEVDPQAKPRQVRRAIGKGAVDLGPKGRDKKFGRGRADAVRSANRL